MISKSSYIDMMCTSALVHQKYVFILLCCVEKILLDFLDIIIITVT